MTRTRTYTRVVERITRIGTMGEGANEDDDDNASRVNGFDGERDGEGEDMTAVNAAPPPTRPPSPQLRVQRAKVRRRVVRRGSGAVDATVFVKKSSEKEE